MDANNTGTGYHHMGTRMGRELGLLRLEVNWESKQTRRVGDSNQRGAEEHVAAVGYS